MGEVGDLKKKKYRRLTHIRLGLEYRGSGEGTHSERPGDVSKQMGTLRATHEGESTPHGNAPN